jgi:hypothetical protein
MGNDLNWNLLISINDLKDFFNVINISHHLFELLHDNCFLNDSLNFLYCLVLVSNLYNFFILFHNFFYLLNNHRNFDNLLDNFFDISVNIH